MAAGLNAYQTQGILMWSSLSLLKSTPISVLLATVAFMVGRDMQGWKRPAVAASLLFTSIAMVHLAATSGITVSGDPSIVLPERLIAPEVLAVLATLVAALAVAAGHVAADRREAARTSTPAVTGAHPLTAEAMLPSVEPASAERPDAAPLLAAMGADILAPLGSLIGQIGALARTNLQPGQQELVDTIRASGATLERRLIDLVDLARVEAGELEIRREALNIAETIGQIAGLAEQRASDRSLAFRLEMDVPTERRVVGDRARITQMALNMVDHAVSSIDGGEVALKVSAGRDSGALRFEVRAAGLSMEDKPQGSSLALAHRLTSLMGGRADASVVDGAAASFAVELPLPESASSAPVVTAPAFEAAPQAAPPPPRKSARASRVLLGEGDVAHRKAIELLLRAAGADVTTAGDGAQLVETFGAAPFDLIVMDAGLPVLDGLSAVRILRELERLRGMVQTPVILLSTQVQPDQIAAILETGADAHLCKPLTAATLGPVLERLLHAVPAAAERLRVTGAAA
jgi:CheY-like chemotaxis protein